MSRRLKQAVVVVIVVFAAAQFIRPSQTNPPTDPSRTIQTHVGNDAALIAVLDRSCNDCHSNRTAWTTWPWYTRVAPLSWVIAGGVNEGRKAVNFSEWAGYSPEQRQILLALSCDDATKGTMPGRPWEMVNPATRLSAQDVETICAAARRRNTRAAGVMP